MSSAPAAFEFSSVCDELRSCWTPAVAAGANAGDGVVPFSKQSGDDYGNGLATMDAWMVAVPKASGVDFRSAMERQLARVNEGQTYESKPEALSGRGLPLIL